MKKDINTNSGIKQVAVFFCGQKFFVQSLFNLITNTIFAIDIRTKNEFEKYGQKKLPCLYKTGNKFILTIVETGRKYQACFDLIQKLSMKHQQRKKTFAIVSDLFKALNDLVPSDFLDLYTYERIKHLDRYISCIAIRAQRAVDNPLKEEKKALQVEKYNRYLNKMLSLLSQKSTKEKSQQVEEFFWMLEEFKISVFAPEIKTAIKISVKRLDKKASHISTMI